MTKAITVRLDEADHAALTRQADQLRVQPGTLARMLVHAGLADSLPTHPDARAAIARLVRRSRRRPPADAVALVSEARAALGPHQLSVVVDASVVVALVVADERQADDVPETWTDVSALGVELHPFDAIDDGAAIASITTRLRRRHATDSTYVRLAQKLSAHVWTLDGSLARNAADVGLPVELIS